MDGEEVASAVGIEVRACVAEWEAEEMERRVPSRSGKKRRFFRNYVSAMVEVCEECSSDDRVRVWMKIYAFMVLSDVLFPCTPYRAV